MRRRCPRTPMSSAPAFPTIPPNSRACVPLSVTLCSSRTLPRRAAGGASGAGRTELATNVIRHGRAPAEVRLLRTGEVLLLDMTNHDLDVTNHDPYTASQPADANAHALSGRGLALAQSFAGYRLVLHPVDQARLGHLHQRPLIAGACCPEVLPAWCGQPPRTRHKICSARAANARAEACGLGSGVDVAAFCCLLWPVTPGDR